MLAAIWDSTIPIALVGPYTVCAKSSLRFDRILAIEETATEGLLHTYTSLLHEGGKALVAIPTAHLERWWFDQLESAVAEDRIGAIVDWTPAGTSADGWTFIVLRTVAPVHLRRRYLVGRVVGAFSNEHIEELVDALMRGTTEAGWLQWRQSLQLHLPGAMMPIALSLTKILERYAERGLDVGALAIGKGIL
jgi:hypothetical protein